MDQGSRAAAEALGPDGKSHGAAASQSPRADDQTAPSDTLRTDGHSPGAVLECPGAVGQGPVVTFSVLQPDGSPTGYRCLLLLPTLLVVFRVFLHHVQIFLCSTNNV